MFKEGPIRKLLKEKRILKHSPEIMSESVEHIAAAFVRELNTAIETSKILQSQMPAGEPVLYVTSITDKLVNLRDEFIRETLKWRPYFKSRR
jgi:hypothetical protein